MKLAWWLFLRWYQGCPFRRSFVGHLQWMPACTASQEPLLKPELLSVVLPWLSVKSLVLLAQDSFACSCKALASVNSYPWMVPVVWLKVWASFPQFPGWQEGCGKVDGGTTRARSKRPFLLRHASERGRWRGNCHNSCFWGARRLYGRYTHFLKNLRCLVEKTKKKKKGFLLSHLGHQKLSGTEVTEQGATCATKKTQQIRSVQSICCTSGCLGLLCSEFELHGFVLFLTIFVL